MKTKLFFSLSFIILLVFSVQITVAQDLDTNNWPSLKGYWKFQDTTDLTKATFGDDLILVGSHEAIAGPNYGDFATRIGIGSYYKSYHNIAPNGGGDSVNRYSLMFDFRVLNFNNWHTFFQTDSTNMNDGECFIKPQNISLGKSVFGTATTGYTPDSIIPMQWYRMVISVCLDSFYRYYIDGNLWLEGDSQFVDGRFALTPLVLFFADNNQEDDTIDISSLAIFGDYLTPQEVASLGSLDPCSHNPKIVDLGVDTILCSTHTLMLDAGTGFKSFLWSTGDTSQTIVVDSNSWGMGSNDVWVRTLDMNDCESTDSIQITFMDCSSIQTSNSEMDFLVYPNPVKDILNINFENGDFNIKVYNLTGQEVIKPMLSLSKDYILDMSGLSKGVYFLKLEFGEFSKTLLITKL